jgi:hypothetical protein
MAFFLTYFFEACGFKTTLDFAEAERLKLPQPEPRSGAPSAVCGNGRFEVQFERLAQIGESLLFSMALTGNMVNMPHARCTAGDLVTGVLPKI